MSMLTAIGLMSGTSLDGIDAALVRSDGADVVETGPSLHLAYEPATRAQLQRAVRAAIEGRDGASDIGIAAVELTRLHARAVGMLIMKAGLAREEIDLIGFHGQTILHRSPRAMDSIGRSWQIGDGANLAEMTRIAVVSDFRAADIAAGGEGAPLAPVYHAARLRAAGCDRPIAVLNVGGVANITFATAGAPEAGLVSFDCGPGNGLIDQWMELKTGASYDKDGATALAGKTHTDRVRAMAGAPFVARRPPKSLDRYDFKIDAVLDLSAADGAATLTALTAACVAASVRHLPEPPARWIVCGGGRLNPAITAALRAQLSAPVVSAEDESWRGDMIEAECFAYLAVRALRGLPITFPRTTGTPAPISGGVIHPKPV
jgi:anhydro-N-acetylmuramic acid kinase